MTDLPDDVREYLEVIANRHPDSTSARLLAKYPKPQPEWQDGDVVLDRGETLLRFNDEWGLVGAEARGLAPLSVSAEADRIARGGRRVHPARFTEHAEILQKMAAGVIRPDPGTLREIAADLAGDSDD